MKTRVRIEVSKVSCNVSWIGRRQGAETKSYEETAMRGGLNSEGRGIRRGEGISAGEAVLTV